MNYRFQLTYESEEARQKWIHSDVHQKVWPTIEHTLTDQKELYGPAVRCDLGESKQMKTQSVAILCRLVRRHGSSGAGA